ncbi:2-oxoacid:acceptor oxidoreductase family protein [Chloroflexota bacterium]
MERKEIRIAGFGGQGIVLSGNIIGKAASIFTNGYAALTQNYGPESRGGSCTAEVVVSNEPVDYPYVTNPQIQIILSQEAYTKYGQNVSSALEIVDSEMVKVNPRQKSRTLSIPASRMAHEEIGRSVVANIIVLGFLAAVSDIVSVEALRSSVLDSIPAGTEEINTRAFELGYDYGMKKLKTGEGEGK